MLYQLIQEPTYLSSESHITVSNWNSTSNECSVNLFNKLTYLWYMSDITISNWIGIFIWTHTSMSLAKN